MRRITVACYRRHSAKCGNHEACNCPVWMRWSKGGQFREPAGTMTMSKAKEKAAALEKKLNSGEAKESVRKVDDGDSLAGKENSFVMGKVNKGLDAATVRKYRCELPRLREFMEAREKFGAGAITADDLIAYAATWEGDHYRSKLTRSSVQTRAKAFLKFAGTPAAELDRWENIKVKERDRPGPAPFTEAELARLLAAVPKLFDARKAARMTALIHCMVSTGLAIRDAAQLERAHIRDGWLQINRQKTGKKVEQMLEPSLLRELMETLNGNPRYVFYEGRGSIHSMVMVLLHDLRRLMKFAGVYVRGNLSHRFRDTATDFWFGQGVGIAEVAALLGDSEIMVERHYKSLSGRIKDRLATVPQRKW